MLSAISSYVAPYFQEAIVPTPDEMLILLGTHDNYIHSALFNPITKSIRPGRSTRTDPHPSWLTRHPRIPDLVYSNTWAEGKISILRLKGLAGDFEVIDEFETSGKGLNFMAILPDCSAIIGAHYGSGSAMHIPLSPDGNFVRNPLVNAITVRLSKWPTPFKHPRQDAPHAHQIVIHGDEILIPDLGTNLVLRQYPPRHGRQWNAGGVVMGYKEGDGPRHVAVHPRGTHLYTLCELSSTLVTHTLPPLPEKQAVSKDGTPVLSGAGLPGAPVCISRHSILPPADKDNQFKMLASEILLLPSPSPGGKHLLICTNRDSPNPEGDAIALFSVDDEGKVERAEQGWITGIGKHLRGMSADKEGRYVAVAGRDGGGLTIFERDLEKGLTLKEVAKLEVEQVVCPLWID